MVLVAFVLRSRVRALTSVDMEDNCWQESYGFLSARGGKQKIKCAVARVRNVDVEDPSSVEEDDLDSFTIDLRSEDDDAEVLADQRPPLDGNWSVKCINRAVLVGTSITPDSNACIKERRPKYWTATEGVSPNIASLPS